MQASRLRPDAFACGTSTPVAELASCLFAHRVPSSASFLFFPRIFLIRSASALSSFSNENKQMKHVWVSAAANPEMLHLARTTCPRPRLALAMRAYLLASPAWLASETLELSASTFGIRETPPGRSLLRLRALEHSLNSLCGLCVSPPQFFFLTMSFLGNPQGSIFTSFIPSGTRDLLLMLAIVVLRLMRRFAKGDCAILEAWYL